MTIQLCGFMADQPTEVVDQTHRGEFSGAVPQALSFQLPCSTWMKTILLEFSHCTKLGQITTMTGRIKFKFFSGSKRKKTEIKQL